MALEIFAASMAWSPKSLWPKEPPLVMTLTFTWSWRRPTACAMFCWARIGTLRPAQTSARSLRTSAMAAYGSSAALLRNMNVKSVSTVCARIGTFGTTIGSSPPRSLDSTVLSDSPATGPGFQSTLMARMASMHCPKVVARTATPVSTTATWVTPGSCRMAAWLLSRFGVPPWVGARQTMVGRASGTSRSVVNFFAPVTASRASVRLSGLPMTLNSRLGRSRTSTASTTWLAASVARSP